MIGNSDFFVVVIDDKPEVCRHVAAKLDGPRGESDPDTRSSVTVSRIEVNVIRKNEADNLMDDAWTFSERVGDQLQRASQRAPDLIIIDYFYVDGNVARQLKAEAKSGSLSRDRLLRRVLSPLDLKQWVENFKPDDIRRTQILKNLFGASCPIYLHSYTPEGMTILAGPIDERRKSLSRVFPNALLIQAIDTRRELFNDDAFDWPNPKSRYDSEYYPYQLAVYFDQVVNKEILRSRLYQGRYLKIRRTATAVAGISAIGGGIGLASAWIGDYVAEAIRGGDLVRGIAIGILLLLALLLLGMACPFLFERLMERILHSREESSA